MKIVKSILVFCFVTLASGQTIHVPLPRLTYMDDGGGMIDIFRKTPAIQVKLPFVDTTGARFIKFYSFWKQIKGPSVVIMILPKKNGEELYIDHNYNNDLSDDGPPRFFRKKDNTFTYDMVNQDDKNQFIRIAYHRKPINNHGDTTHLKYLVDRAYNMNTELVSRVRLGERCPEFDGKYGSFFWTDRLVTHRGTVNLDGTNYVVGMNDWTYDGIYDDVKVRGGDRFYIDYKHRGKLYGFDPSSYVSIQDTFSIGPNKYRLKAVDKYGQWIELEIVDGAETFYYVREQQTHSSRKKSDIIIDSTWQQIQGMTIDSSLICLEDYKGKYLLLNFWGEWCSGCRTEIPVLKNATMKMPKSKFQIVSFLYTPNLEKAKKFIKDSSITWPQIVLQDGLEKKFKVSGYPTNILISPDGRGVMRTMVLDEKFIKDNIH
jgi:thiol-disulfide isomerase/thioredoxin